VDPVSWPVIDMSYALRIDQYDENGELVGNIDNSESIDEQIALHNEARGFDPDAPATQPGAPPEDESSGCACRAAGHATDGRALFFVATLLAAAYRRRRKRR
jgi:MYXO-CTERM domain-containing protein